MDENLATEMLKELSKGAKRWFIAFVTVLVLWFATIGIFIWYLTLPAEEGSYNIEQQADQSSINTIAGGDLNYGSTAEN